MDRWGEWIEVASLAGFRPYELVDPAPEDACLAGYGGTSTGSLHMDLQYTVHGHTLGVGTATGGAEGEEEGVANREIATALESMLSDRKGLPLTLTVEETAIEVQVDGQQVTFRGLQVGGHADCVVRARLDADTVITIEVSGDVLPSALRRRADLSDLQS